jgi:hypothetical protein
MLPNFTPAALKAVIGDGKAKATTHLVPLPVESKPTFVRFVKDEQGRWFVEVQTTG